MERISLSRKAFNSLIASLVELEESQMEILDYCFPLPDKEREDMDSMITGYINRMNETLERVVVVDFPQCNRLPFVVIGSKIVIQEVESQVIDEFRLILPAETSVSEGDISILSPIGKSLLLQQSNSIVECDTPGGKFRYKILSIHF